MNRRPKTPKTDPDQAYRDAAESLSSLTGKMIEYLRTAPENSLGGRWRDLAEHAVSRFNTAKMRQRQGNLFGEPEDS